MKMSKIYRLAAKQIEEDVYSEYGCITIKEVSGRDFDCCSETPSLPKWLHVMEMFRPSELASCGGWWHHTDRGSRILGLCFMAAIAESEERKRSKSR